MPIPPSSPQARAAHWIKSLDLTLHPEGGYYREVHRAAQRVQTLPGGENKSASTSIYYLLASPDFSAWHRVHADETWYFHDGCDLNLYYLNTSQQLQTQRIGFGANCLQTTIAAHTWFAAEPCDADGFCLVSCAVAPGFEFTDFELAQPSTLLAAFSGSAEERNFITRLSRA